jgi:hypothetical protein
MQFSRGIPGAFAMKAFFPAIFLFFACGSPAQNDSLKALLALFKPAGLPLHVNFNSEAVMAPIYQGDSKDGVSYNDYIPSGVDHNDSLIEIPPGFLPGYFHESAVREDLGEYADTAQYFCFALWKLPVTGFYALLYEKYFLVSGMSSAEKYLVTIDSCGKFISKLMLASCVYSGTSIYSDPDDPGAYDRRPWYPINFGNIDKDRSITIYFEENAKQGKYKIDKEGNIIGMN